MTRTILISTEPKLQDIYKNSDLIEVVELPDSLVQDMYQANDYKVIIKKSSEECELLAGKKDEENGYYKWGVNVNSGELETFKNALKNDRIRFIEE